MWINYFFKSKKYNKPPSLYHEKRQGGTTKNHKKWNITQWATQSKTKQSKMTTSTTLLTHYQLASVRVMSHIRSRHASRLLHRSTKKLQTIPDSWSMFLHLCSGLLSNFRFTIFDVYKLHQGYIWVKS